MNVPIDLAMQKVIEVKLRSGRYSTPEEVLYAGLATLDQQETFGDFEPGELDRLLAAGERSIERDGTFTANEVQAELRQRSAQRRTNGR